MIVRNFNAFRGGVTAIDQSVATPVTPMEVYWYTAKSIGVALVFGAFMYFLGRNKRP